jgi:hypothetical protein
MLLYLTVLETDGISRIHAGNVHVRSSLRLKLNHVNMALLCGGLPFLKLL